MKNILLDAVVVVAGGSGRRMKSKIPKQFLPIGNLPVLMRTLTVFYEFCAQTQIILVLPKAQIDYWQNLCREYNFSIQHTIVEGGQERFFSVKNGIEKINAQSGIVAIHDGVRPLVDLATIRRGVQAAQKHKATIPVIVENNSVRVVENGENCYFDRNKIRIVQTPQVFDIELIKKAYRLPYSSAFTDDASVVEKLGEKIFLFEGNMENIKITTNFDLNFANFLLSS